MSTAGFARLVHADWSVAAPGRWLARAARVGGCWAAEAPEPVPPLDRFVDELVGGSDALLAGFDFPIGLPERFGAASGWASFPDALERLPPTFFEVAGQPAEIGPERPFYPARPGGTTRAHLLAGHGVTDIGALLRRCERPGAGRRAAGCLFWTLGAAQVGRAALNGWQHVVRPARRRGAALWPFDGSLAALAAQGGATLAETYPADGYPRLGAAFRRQESKRRAPDRAGKAEALFRWADRRGVALSAGLRAMIAGGFGAADRGGDRFDAVIGLFAMIDALEDGTAEAPDDAAVRRWEGWILGRRP